MNFGCPLCKVNLIIYYSSFKIWQMIKCPNENWLKKIIIFINYEKKLINHKNKNIKGKRIKYDYVECESFVQYKITGYDMVI